MATIPQILSHVWPGTKWSIGEDNYETLVWEAENTVIKPSEAEIRSHSEVVDALINDEQQRSRQQRALNDAPDYLLRALETLIEGMIEIRRVVNDIRTTAVAGSHTGNYTAWDNAVVSKLAAMRQKIIDLRNLG